MAKLSIKVGDPAPVFEGLDHAGSSVRLSDYRGKKHLLLYFYPKDSTPGCTAEARGFNRSLFEFEKRNTVVHGVSTDDVQSHERFRNSCSLQFQLIADHHKQISRAYGAIGGLMGILGMARRVTVLIDKEGVVRSVWTSVNPQNHPDEVLKEIDRLGLR